jgi:protein arginine kinase activator
MLCSICKEQPANVHLTQITEGKFIALDLCPACAQQKGINDPTGFSLADLLVGLESPPHSPGSRIEPPQPPQ